MATTDSECIQFMNTESSITAYTPLTVSNGARRLTEDSKPASAAQSQRNAPQGSEKEAKQKMVPLSASSHDDLRPFDKNKNSPFF
jgi:hypothetical protein